MSCGNATAAVISNGTRPTKAIDAIVTRHRAMKAYQALSRLDKLHPQPPRGLHYRRKAQADHVRVAALDGVDMGRAQTLDRVATGLVDTLSRVHVAIYLTVRKPSEPYPGPDHAAVRGYAQPQGMPRVDVVGRAGQQPQELGVLFPVDGLVDDLSAHDDGRVRCDHESVGIATGEDGGLGRCQAAHERLRAFLWQDGLVDVRRFHGEGESQAAEELSAAWRCAGQHDAPHVSKSTHGQGAVRLPAEMANEDKKRAAAEAALELVRDGMTLGLGTGSTARWFVAGVGERVASGRLRDLACVPTSKATAEQATAAGLRLVELPTAGVDLAVDGMDELTPSLDAIKGLGGALLREKIVAAAAATFVLVGDDTKLVSRLGEKALVPVEVVPFGMRRTVEVLAGLCDQVEP